MKNSILILLLFLISCSEKHQTNYQTSIVYNDMILYIGDCNETNFQNENELEPIIRKKIEHYVKNKVGEKFFAELEFDNGKVFTNENGKCSYDFDYPLYSITYNLDFKKSGFKEFSLAFLMDKNGKIIDQIEFPKVKPNSEKFELISLEKINEILEKRKISSEHLHITFSLDKKENSFFWYATTIIGGMGTKQGCFATSKLHFKVNAITGKITEYDNENLN